MEFERSSQLFAQKSQICDKVFGINPTPLYEGYLETDPRPIPITLTLAVFQTNYGLIQIGTAPTVYYEGTIPKANQALLVSTHPQKDTLPFFPIELETPKRPEIARFDGRSPIRVVHRTDVLKKSEQDQITFTLTDPLRIDNHASPRQDHTATIYLKNFLDTFLPGKNHDRWLFKFTDEDLNPHYGIILPGHSSLSPHIIVMPDIPDSDTLMYGSKTEKKDYDIVLKQFLGTILDQLSLQSKTYKSLIEKYIDPKSETPITLNQYLFAMQAVALKYTNPKLPDKKIMNQISEHTIENLMETSRVIKSTTSPKALVPQQTQLEKLKLQESRNFLKLPILIYPDQILDFTHTPENVAILQDLLTQINHLPRIGSIKTAFRFATSKLIDFGIEDIKTKGDFTLLDQTYAPDEHHDRETNDLYITRLFKDTTFFTDTDTPDHIRLHGYKAVTNIRGILGRLISCQKTLLSVDSNSNYKQIKAIGDAMSQKLKDLTRIASYTLPEDPNKSILRSILMLQEPGMDPEILPELFTTIASQPTTTAEAATNVQLLREASNTYIEKNITTRSANAVFIEPNTNRIVSRMLGQTDKPVRLPIYLLAQRTAAIIEQIRFPGNEINSMRQLLAASSESSQALPSRTERRRETWRCYYKKESEHSRTLYLVQSENESHNLRFTDYSKSIQWLNYLPVYEVGDRTYLTYGEQMMRDNQTYNVYLVYGNNDERSFSLTGDIKKVHANDTHIAIYSTVQVDYRKYTHNVLFINKQTFSSVSVSFTNENENMQFSMPNQGHFALLYASDGEKSLYGYTIREFGQKICYFQVNRQDLEGTVGMRYPSILYNPQDPNSFYLSGSTGLVKFPVQPTIFTTRTFISHSPRPIPWLTYEAPKA